MGRAAKTKRAVKIIKKEQMNEEEKISFQTEMSLLRKLDHPNILKLYEVFEDQKKYFLVTEYCKGGELFEEIVSRVTFSERDASRIIS
jgi:calcium-dependent protein kinase